MSFLNLQPRLVQRKAVPQFN